MKRISLLPAALFCTLAGSAQKNIPASKVPAAAKEAFATAHAGVKGVWEKEDGQYEVSFTEGGKKMSCVLSKDGSITETETVIPVTQLPAAVRTAIAKKHKSAKVKEAAIIVKADGTTVYEAEIKGHDLLFDADGKELTAKKDKD